MKPITECVAVVRGGGDLATGVVQKLWRTGFRVAILEVAQPLAIRRTVALSEAATRGAAAVEDVHARRVSSASDCPSVWAAGMVPLLIDPACESLAALQPDVLVDAILAKRNLGTSASMAPVVIALGPGFEAPDDAHAVVETMRGHRLGRLIFSGAALPNTGIPGELGGHTSQRVVHAPASGRVRHHRAIGDRVRQGDLLLAVGDTPVLSPLDGTLRGLIAEGLTIPAGLKCADVDPRPPHEVDYLTISDKARALGGAVLEAALLLLRRQGIL